MVPKVRVYLEHTAERKANADLLQSRTQILNEQVTPRATRTHPFARTRAPHVRAPRHVGTYAHRYVGIGMAHRSSTPPIADGLHSRLQMASYNDTIEQSIPVLATYTERCDQLEVH